MDKIVGNDKIYHYLSIDFGDSYVGLSVSNGFLAKPIEVFKYPCGNYPILRKYLLKIITLIKPEIIIIGVPSKEESENKIKSIFLSSIFKEENLKKRIIWVNEDYSTKEAIKLKKRKRIREDSIAASLILDNYLARNLGRKKKNNE